MRGLRAAAVSPKSVQMCLSRFGKTVGMSSPHVLGLFKVVIS
jgi:hypothetical protein